MSGIRRDESKENADQESHTDEEEDTVFTVPGSKRKLMRRRIWATRMAKDKLAWM